MRCMRCLMTLVVAGSLVLTPVYAQKGQEGAKSKRDLLTNVVVKTEPEKLKKGRDAYTFDVQAGAKIETIVCERGTRFVVKVVGGKRTLISDAEGREQLKVGKVITLTGKASKRGTLAILITL